MGFSPSQVAELETIRGLLRMLVTVDREIFNAGSNPVLTTESVCPWERLERVTVIKIQSLSHWCIGLNVRKKRSYSQVTFGVISVGMNIRNCQISDVTNQVLLRVAYG